MKRLLVIFIAVLLFSSFFLETCNFNSSPQKQAAQTEQAKPDPYQALPPSEPSPAPPMSVGPG